MNVNEAILTEVASTLDRLPMAAREMLAAEYLYELTPDEAAEVAGIPAADAEQVKAETTEGVYDDDGRAVQQRGTATHARYGCPGLPSTHAPGCTVRPRAGPCR